MRYMLLTLKVSEGLQGLQAITWSGLWESTHIPEAELVLPPSSGEWKQPVGRVNLLSPTLSPHHIAYQGYRDWSWWIAPHMICIFSAVYKKQVVKGSTYVFHQGGQSAKMLAQWRSRKRLGFLSYARSTATVDTEDADYSSKMLFEHITSLFLLCYTFLLK